MNLQGKIAIVTGASRGIGKAIAKMFLDYGVYVIGTSTKKEGCMTIQNYLKKSGTSMQLDVSDVLSINNFFIRVNQKFDNIDILINNAGIIHDKLLINMNENEWQSVIDTNLTSIFRISKIVIKIMLKKRYGRIINISSLIGYTGNVGQTNYAASKAGLNGFSKSLAMEVASRGITVNTVSPGFICTNMNKSFKKKYYKNILSKIPARRFGLPKEVANVVVFLASDKASYITGENIHVNGGMYMI